jgi:hypothetical protein
MTVRTKYLMTVFFIAGLMPVAAAASCVIEPLEPQLRAADIVYVGTVVRSDLVPAVDSLRNLKHPRDHLVEISHSLVPRIVLKGNPAKARTVLSTWQYNDPLSKIEVEFGERQTLMPGDSLLIVAESGEPTYFGLCTATRKWNAETAESVRAVFPTIPSE